MGTTPDGHSSNRPFRFIGFSPGGTIESSGAGPLVLSGSLTSTSSSTVNRTLSLGGANIGDNTFGGIISAATGTGVLNVVKSGTGRWVLTAANTYEGSTVVNGGELVVRGPSGAINGGAVTVAAAGTLILDGGAISTPDIDVVGTINFRSGSIALGTGGQTIPGPLAIGTNGPGSMTITASVGTNNFGTLTVHGPDDSLTITGGVNQMFALDNSQGGTLNFSGGSVQLLGGQVTTAAGTLGGNIGGSGGVTKIGPGVLNMAAGITNLYTGPTNINQGTLRILGSGDQLSNSTLVTIAAGATLDVAGSEPEVFGALQGAGTLVIGAQVWVAREQPVHHLHRRHYRRHTLQGRYRHPSP